MRRTLISSLCLAAAVAGSARDAAAQVCEPDRKQEALSYLRRLTLDLLGRLPTYDELASVATNGAVDPALIDQMLATEDAVAQLREHHRDLLWANVSTQRLANNNWNLRGPDMRTGQRYMSPGYWSPQRADVYRGAQEPCLDEPARFGAGGEILTTADPMRAGVAKEGWVMVRPYWAPSTEVKVCAFDAQSAATAPNPRPNGAPVDCSRQVAKGCGCGPNLSWCQSVTDQTQLTIDQSFDEQMLRFIDGVVRSGRPYTEIITSKEIEVNGPISHYYRYMTPTGQNLLYSAPDPNFDVPRISFDQKDTWTKVQRGQRHAGLLTMPAYLIKFQSDRGRANRFYNAFLCQYFEAPAGGLPPADDACHTEPNLTKRCGCKYCHVTVEPAAAYWGRWSEAGIAPLNEDPFVKMAPNCATAAGANNAVCKRFYFVNAVHPDEQPYKGMLLPYVFADAQRERNIATGPEGIARDAIDSGKFAQCATRRMWERYVGREPVESDGDALASLTSGFQSNGYDLKKLIKAMVTRPEYVQGGNFTGVKE